MGKEMKPMEKALRDAIILDPKDAVSRMALADWLEDEGRCDEASWARENTERTYSLTVVHDCSTLEWLSDMVGLVMFEHDNRLVFDTLPPATFPVLRIKGLFLSGVVVPSFSDWSHFGRSLMAAHPLESVGMARKGPASLAGGKYRAWNVDDDSSSVNMSNVIPTEVFALLPEGEVRIARNWKAYGSLARAEAALSHAMLEWARMNKP